MRSFEFSFQNVNRNWFERAIGKCVQCRHVMSFSSDEYFVPHLGRNFYSEWQQMCREAEETHAFHSCVLVCVWYVALSDFTALFTRMIALVVVVVLVFDCICIESTNRDAGFWNWCWILFEWSRTVWVVTMNCQLVCTHSPVSQRMFKLHSPRQSVVEIFE